MISSANHDSVSRLVADRPMCLATALDKAFENIDCMIAILSCQTKNRFYESTQRLIQLRRVLCKIAVISRCTRPCEFVLLTSVIDLIIVGWWMKFNHYRQ